MSSSPVAGSDNGSTERPPERALVLVPIPPRSHQVKRGGDEAHIRHPEAQLEEAIGLARAIDLEIVDGLTVPLSSYRPATLIGSGKVAELKARIESERVGLVVVDHVLSPVQQRNLEREWKAKVIDRAGLILEIFGERAETREGRLQVELAHLSYQRSRLVRSWTHLERQRGGFGFLGGPGETQIEADRRMIQERISRIEEELEAVKRTRRLQRQSRKRAMQPVVALVGYTNAGKSTLFNTLTEAGVLAKDLLFATLDPTLRKLRLPHGTEAVLSDTVGFISDLPTHLVAAFRATLEEVVEADLILHVRDISHPDTEAQARDVAGVLLQLGIGEDRADRMIEVWNKVDLLPDRRMVEAAPERAMSIEGVSVTPISALTGEGVPELLALIEEKLTGGRSVYRIDIGPDEMSQLHRLYELAEVIERTDEPDGHVSVRARVPEKSLARFRSVFPRARKAG